MKILHKKDPHVYNNCFFMKAIKYNTSINKTSYNFLNAIENIKLREQQKSRSLRLPKPLFLKKNSNSA